MVQAMINIPEDVNHIISIVKAKYKLKTKSEAIAKIVEEYGEDLLEPELRPEYVEKIRKIEKEGKFVHFDSFEELKKSIENA